eukprot:3878618-Prymnesium_polylepis.1
MELKPTMLEDCDIRLRCTQNPLSPKPSAISPHLSSRLAPMIARLSSLAAGSCPRPCGTRAARPKMIKDVNLCIVRAMRSSE